MIKSWLTALLLALGLVSPALAQAPDMAKHGKVTLLAERASVVPGDQFLAGLKVDIEDGWHIYWRNAGDSGEAPSIKWTTPDGKDAAEAGVTFGEFQYAPPEFEQISSELGNYVYKHQAVLPFNITAPADAKPGARLELRGKVTLLICADICIPERHDISLSLPYEPAQRTDEAGSAEIAKWLALVPPKFTGQATAKRDGKKLTLSISDPEVAAAAQSGKPLRFYTFGQDVAHAQPQKVSRGPNGVTFELAVSDYASDGDLVIAGVVATEIHDAGRKAWEIEADPGQPIGGTSGTAVSTSANGQPAGAGGVSGEMMGFAALAAMVGAAFLGGLVLNLMPCVLPVLSIKAASLVQHAHKPSEARAHGIAYLGGVLVTFVVIGGAIVGLRAAGEQVGLGTQLQYAPVVAAFALLMFAMGLNLLGMFEWGSSLMGVGGNLADQGGAKGAFFTGALAAFVGAPCVGPFMAPAVGAALTQPWPIVLLMFAVIGIGLAAPFVALSFTPALARVLPKPGKWMVTFRQVLAFPMFLTALWLLWVAAAQTGPDGVLWIVGGAIALAFGIWLAQKIGSKTTGKAVAAAVILASVGVPVALTATAKPAPSGPGVVSAEAAAIGAEPWSAERVAALRAEGKAIFIDFTAKWCVTCQMNKRGAILTEPVKKAFADNGVVFMEADWTSRDDSIAAELAVHGRAGVPLYLMYPASGGEPEVLPQLLSPGLIVQAVEKAAGKAS